MEFEIKFIDWDGVIGCPDCDGEGDYWVSVDMWSYSTGHYTDDTGQDVRRRVK